MREPSGYGAREGAAEEVASVGWWERRKGDWENLEYKSQRVFIWLVERKDRLLLVGIAVRLGVHHLSLGRREDGQYSVLRSSILWVSGRGGAGPKSPVGCSHGPILGVMLQLT